MAKKRVCLYVDEDLWDLADHKLEISKSEFVTQQLEYVLRVKDDESICLDKINDLKNELNVWENKLCAIRKQKEAENISNELFDNAMKTITRIHEKVGFVGQNQIKNIAHQNELKASDLENHIKNTTDFEIRMFGDAGYKKSTKSTFGI